MDFQQEGPNWRGLGGNLRVPGFPLGSGFRPLHVKISSRGLMCVQTVLVCADSNSAGMGEVSGCTFLSRSQGNTVLLIQGKQCSQDTKGP